jgi:hypothetical protein
MDEETGPLALSIVLTAAQIATPILLALILWRVW